MARFTRFTRKPRFSRFSRKRRKSNATWFPVTGTAWNNGPSTYYDSTINVGTLTPNTDKVQGAVSFVAPVTEDFTLPVSSWRGTLNDTLKDIVEGSTWSLQRLVGNIFVRVEPSTGEQTENDVWDSVQVGAGFFTARANDSDVTLPDLTFDEFDVFGLSNIVNPWIWRRSWILQNAGLGADNGVNDFPVSNVMYGPDSDAHIDTKIKRRIPREHRLWFTLAVLGWDAARGSVNGTDEEQPKVKAALDLRIIGGMRSGRNRISSF